MKVSVIVPVYNVEDYIKECIESIINQEFPSDKFEILVIDDGATDKSIEKVKIYFESYENLRIISQKNKGLSGARNTGLRNAKGEYILFIDSDDFIQKDFIKVLYKYITKHNLDAVFSSYNLYFDEKKIVPYKAIYNTNKILSRKEAMQELLNKKTYRAEVCYAIYKKEFLREHDIRFTEGIINEDEEFTLKILLNAKNVGYLNYNGYMYRQREGSITKSINYKKIIDSRFILLDNFIREFKNSTQDISKEFILWRVDDLMKGFLINLKKSGEKSKYDLEKISSYIKFLKANSRGINKIKYSLGLDVYTSYLLFILKIKRNVKKFLIKLYR